jgi:hypothetical protein
MERVIKGKGNHSHAQRLQELARCARTNGTTLMVIQKDIWLLQKHWSKHFILEFNNERMGQTLFAKTIQ